MVTALKKTRPAKKVVADGAQAQTIAATSAVAALRVMLGMPRTRFARLVGRTERAVVDWETGKSRPQGLSQQRIHELQRLTQALKRLFDSKTLGAWFDAPNKALGGFKPVELIERGESDRLWHMIFELQSGAHV